MSIKLMQLNFTFTVTPTQYEEAVAPLAEHFAQVDGLKWKIWITNPEARQAGGIYLFENEAAVDAFLAGPLADGVKKHPAIRALDVRVSDVMGELTAATRGPVELPEASVQPC